MTTKSYLLMALLLHGFLLAPASAAEKTPDECGLASLYSSVSEATASGEDTLAEDFTLHIEHCHSGRWSRSTTRKMDGRRWCGLPIAALSSPEELLMSRRRPRANSIYPV